MEHNVKHLTKKVLILTSSGGGGLLQTAIAKEQQILLENQYTEIVKRDLLKDWIGFGASLWDYAQKSGRVWILVFLLKGQKVADFVFWPRIFLSMLSLLFKENIDRVIDTQPVGTSALLKAMRLYNRFKKKKVVLEKVMIDLPTKEATHFFRSIKKLSKKDRCLVQLFTIDPLLEKGETNQEFWLKNCGLSEEQIYYEKYPVRSSFKKYQNKKRDTQPFLIKIRYSSNEEKQMMKKTFERGGILNHEREGFFEFVVAPTHKVITILLGSQPTYNSTIEYVKNVIRYSEQLDQKVVLFVFCKDFDKNNYPLFYSLCEYIASICRYPLSLSVIPFSFQKDDVLAPLFFRSDMTITRSGGGTAMELMSVMQGEMFIHSETKSKDPSRKELLNGIPGHEGGSACYLEQKVGAKIVTPELFSSFVNIRHEKALNG